MEYESQTQSKTQTTWSAPCAGSGEHNAGPGHSSTCTQSSSPPAGGGACAPSSRPGTHPPPRAG